jgi:hypothetical protein
MKGRAGVRFGLERSDVQSVITQNFGSPIFHDPSCDPSRVEVGLGIECAARFDVTGRSYPTPNLFPIAPYQVGSRGDKTLLLPTADGNH